MAPRLGVWADALLTERLLGYYPDVPAFLGGALPIALRSLAAEEGALVLLNDARPAGDAAVLEAADQAPGRDPEHRQTLRGADEVLAVRSVAETNAPYRRGRLAALPVPHAGRVIAAVISRGETAADADLPELFIRLFPVGLQRARFSHSMAQSGYEAAMIGTSAAILETSERVARIARADCPVLITGASGTGKELVARAIHLASRRRDRPFVAVNCGAFSADDLIASELFGCVKGAYTDARSDRKGRFELADRGTIFLDEVSSTRPAMQVALLRVLRSGEIQKVGDEEGGQRVDVRVVAATNENLDELVRDKAFRDDLYSRLRVTEIRMPPLCQRREDIPLLARHFVDRFSRRDGLPAKPISSDAMMALVAYSWPDNVAGLESAIRSALLLGNGPEILVQDLSDDIQGRGEPRAQANRDAPTSRAEAEPRFPSLVAWRRAREREYVREVLVAHQWNVSRSARCLGISRQGLQRKMRHYLLTGAGR